MIIELIINMYNNQPIDVIRLSNIINYPKLINKRVFKNKSDTIRMLLGQGLIMLGLSKIFNINKDIIYRNLNVTKLGKPFLKDYSYVYFNVSHTGEYVGCIFNTSKVGLDIQKEVNFDVHDIAKNCFSREEYLFLLKSKKFENEFIKLWTRKEALCKAKGEGLNEKILLTPVIKKTIMEYKISSFKLSNVCWQSVSFCDSSTNLLLYKVSIENILLEILPQPYCIIKI